LINFIVTGILCIN